MGISDEHFVLLRSSIEASTSKKINLSLGSHIIERLEHAKRLGSAWLESDNDEMVLLWKFLTYQEALARRGFLFLEDVVEDAVEDPGATTNVGDTLVSEDDSAHMLAALISGRKAAWRELQQFYLQKARIVLCTATTAGRKVLRGLCPLTVIVEEASQLTESTVIISILESTVTSMDANEFYDCEKLSFFARLLTQGVPDVKLLRQYQMTPQIADFLNQEFYDSRLVTNPTANKHCKAFQASMRQRYGVKTGDCFFISVTNCSLWRRRNASSMFNPEYVTEVTDLVFVFIKAGLSETDIMVLSYYSEEIRVLKQAIHGILKYIDIEIKSVDSTQGSEAKVVILSTTRPGGSRGMGFVADRQQQNVALTRAREGLVIVGHANMGNSFSVAAQSWVKLINHYRERDRLISLNGNRQKLVSALKIPNENDFVEVIAR
ncbi:AAA domain-containing protein [Aspergillus bertholletiae]|uniref:AAA domain-containing protein n=1 Tax=Aspergillus bertholletiae TaxID=1226010 RepID=A0A5N7BIH2_9EURO|nr:AAA domain-containing protein [Aspergillus bertholletiae]